MFRSIRSVLAAALLLVSVLVTVISFVTAYLIVNRIRTGFAVDYSRSYAGSVRKNITQTLDEYIRMSRIMADLPSVREWLGNDTNPALRQRAFADLTAVRTNMKSAPGIFQAADRTFNYYFNNRLLVRMHPDRKDDRWFFRMKRERVPFALEIDIDGQTSVIRFWINRAVYADGRFLGVVGCGMDISRYIAALLTSDHPGATTMLIDGKGLIKAHPDRSLINTKTIHDLVSVASDTALNRILEKRDSRIRQVPIEYRGEERIAAIGYTGNTGWYTLVLMDPAVIVSVSRFIPIFLIQLAGFLIAFAVTWLLTNRTVLTPLIDITRAMDRLGADDLDRRLETTARFELKHLTDTYNRMLDRLQSQQDQLIARERLEKEFEIVRQMQTSILPAIPEQSGYQLSARMIPADEVGGDYYDFYRTNDGRIWYGIGDVTGHGITAGIIMLMAQSAVNTILQIMPDISPNQLSVYVNRALYENIHNRLHSGSYMTFYFLEAGENGMFRYSGAHCDLLIYRAETGQCERIAPDGTWLGIFEDISHEIVQREFHLAPGDILVLYTDGIIEAMDENREQFGIERLSQIIENNHGLPVSEIKQIIFEEVGRHMTAQNDDLTVFLIRRDER